MTRESVCDPLTGLWTTVDNGKPVRAQPTIADVLTERGAKYGPFTVHARITQELKATCFGNKVNAKFTDSQAEAIEMICHKLGRIINGDANYADSWVDIAGYAQLVADELNGVIR